MYKVVTMNPEEGASSRKRETIMRIAEETAIGLRRSTRKNNIRQSVDFVNGLIFAGILLQKNTPEDGSLMQSFSHLFQDQSEALVDYFKGGQGAAAIAEMAMHDVGIVDQTPTEMLVLVGISAQGVITEVGQEYDLSKWDQMLIVAYIVVAAVFANSNDHDLGRTMKKVALAVSQKTKVWDDIIPADDEWMNDPD